MKGISALMAQASGKKSGFVTQIKSLKRICHFAAANVSLLINAMYILIDFAVG